MSGYSKFTTSAKTFFLSVLAGAVQLSTAKETEAVLSIDTGDNAWMMISAALVLLMTAPGLALFYGGLSRRKNVLSTMMYSFSAMGIVSVLWAFYGYSVAFGEGNAFFGNPFQYFLLKGVGAEPNPTYAATIPQQTFMLFQLMFAIITPALISGAFAERMKYGAFVLFTILWSTFIYFPLAHMVWGAGGLFNWVDGATIPALDFAGGTVVHISSGVSALVCALVLGKRLGYPTESMLPHNIVFSLIGAALLWVGWFGFNAGSALGASSLATSAFAATHFASAAAALGWMMAEKFINGKATVLGAASGMVAGLVAITPAAGFVTVPAAMLIGLASGVVCLLAVSKLKHAFGYDDSLDAFGIHGIGGILGALATGLLASPLVNEAIVSTYEVDGVAMSLAGSLSQLMRQGLSVMITIAIAAIGSYIILKVVDATIGLRVTPEEENNGLDLSLHGENAYIP